MHFAHCGRSQDQCVNKYNGATFIYVVDVKLYVHFSQCDVNCRTAQETNREICT